MITAILGGVFFLLVMLIGGERTAKSFITFLENAVILTVAIWTIYQGANVIAVMMMTCVAISAVSLFYQNEVNVKTKAAFTSVLLVSLIMTALIFVFVYHGHIQGVPGTEFYSIRPANGYNGNIGVNMLYIEVFVILVSLIGSAIDTALAVTSGCYEVVRHNPEMNIQATFSSGMRIGGEVLNSTVNTLVFVFLGEFLVMFVNLVLYYPMYILINSKEFAQGVICIIISAAGSVAVVPIAALLIGICIRRSFNATDGDCGEKRNING